ncbi:hypothetical protein GCM10017673_34490 [Streptosporangium violaceochromogenes]|nr:hypothetical protein GCM10017673_34490 [Streptosporangium violaceochromogenes]
MAEFVPDVPPLALPDAERLGAADFMALQLPVSLVGYHTQSVDETLDRVARALSERDTRIAVLEQRVTEMLSAGLQSRREVHTGPSAAPRTEHEPEGPEEPPGPPPAPPESFGDWEDERRAAPEAEKAEGEGERRAAPEVEESA